MKVKVERDEVDHVRIGELARRTGVSTRRLRYYEEQELLHPVRSDNAYRDYDEAAVEQVGQIRGLIEAGVSSRVVRMLLPCVHGPGAELPHQVNPQMAQQLQDELSNLHARIRHLTTSRDQLECYLARVT